MYFIEQRFWFKFKSVRRVNICSGDGLVPNEQQIITWGPEPIMAKFTNTFMCHLAMFLNFLYHDAIFSAQVFPL